MEKETLEETNMDKFLKLVSDEKSTWIEDLEHYNKNKEELDANFEAELNDLITAQEALEEAAARYTCGWGEDDDEKAFIAGAKWQQERMYSEEEVLTLILQFNDDKPGSFDASQWFEQNKKK